MSKPAGPGDKRNRGMNRAGDKRNRGDEEQTGGAGGNNRITNRQSRKQEE